MKNALKKMLWWIGIAFLIYFPKHKSYSQSDSTSNINLRADLGKDIVNFEKNLWPSSLYAEAELNAGKIFVGLEALVSPFNSKNYSKINLGVNIMKKDKISINPELAFLGNIEDIVTNNPYIPENSTFRVKAGVGTKVCYNLNNFKGNAEIITPFIDIKNPYFYTRHSCRLLLGEIEASYRSKNLKENFLNIKFTTKPLNKKKNVGLFIEYGLKKEVKSGEPNEFVSIGLSLIGKEKY